MTFSNFKHFFGCYPLLIFIIFHNLISVFNTYLLFIFIFLLFVINSEKIAVMRRYFGNPNVKGKMFTIGMGRVKKHIQNHIDSYKNAIQNVKLFIGKIQ